MGGRMNTSLLDLMGDTGGAIQAAVNHADVVAPGWSDGAYAALRAYAKANSLFKSEDVRRHAHASGLPQPPDARAWGAVFQRAARDGLIRRVGYGKSMNRVAHGRPATVWQTA